MQAAMKTLLEQMRITELEVDYRKRLLDFTRRDMDVLVQCRPLITRHIDRIVDEFYRIQTSNPDIANLIGDADTLERLQCAQRRYIMDLFSGVYGMEYINNRLRIGLVHKRIGVEPKLYLSAVHLLRSLLLDCIDGEGEEGGATPEVIKALDKLIYFDVTLVFETYIQSMLAEIETARSRTEEYAKSLEDTVARRTGELRTDALTGLTSRRYLHEDLHRTLQAAQRRNEPVSVVFVDVDNFKDLNDRKGHAYGDKVLQELGRILLEIARGEDTCVRFGGDEFCVVLANATESQTQLTYCQRVNTLLAERLPDVTISMGVIQTGPHEYEEADALLKNADSRMYTQKNIKNRHHQQPSTHAETDSS
tara:strand:+ start:2490 stop:3581 length:1092 start_codon:yes stop_codon:yes gene_type:complete